MTIFYRSINLSITVNDFVKAFFTGMGASPVVPFGSLIGRQLGVTPGTEDDIYNIVRKDRKGGITGGGKSRLLS